MVPICNYIDNKTLGAIWISKKCPCVGIDGIDSVLVSRKIFTEEVYVFGI